MAIEWNPSHGATLGVEWEVQLIDSETKLLRQDPSLEAAQAARLARLRRERAKEPVARGLSALKTAAEGDENVLYPLRDALRADATLGEVCDALRDVWGEYQPREI